jgi:hypothetical protein
MKYKRQDRDLLAKYQQLLRLRLQTEKRLMEMDRALLGLALTDPDVVIAALTDRGVDVDEISETPDDCEPNSDWYAGFCFEVVRRLCRTALKAKKAKTAEAR